MSNAELDLILYSDIRAIVIRTAWLYSTYGKNFVKSMIKYGTERDELNVVFDQVGTPTYAADLADAILQILPQLQAMPKPYTDLLCGGRRCGRASRSSPSGCRSSSGSAPRRVRARCP